jgi:hypothetical protein
MDGLAYNLGRIDWDLFGTLTFRSVPSIKRAHCRAFAFLRQTAVRVRRPFPELLWVLRSELGETNGRFHFHFLLGGSQTRNVITLSHQLEHSWGGRVGRNSIAKIRPYDRSRSGAAYVTKCLTEGTSGANGYELSKFNLADQATVSYSTLRVMKQLRWQRRIQDDVPECGALCVGHAAECTCEKTVEAIPRQCCLTV